MRDVMKRLAAIEHVKVLRIHTRVPVAEPARVTAELVRAIKVKGKPTYVALHINHPRELTPAARAACARMADAGLVLLGQSVLLAGVNDTPEVLGDLMRALVECRIKPYYLHHGDLAPGTAHFRTGIATGQELDAGLARPIVGPMPAGLRARYPRRPRQIADRSELSRAGRIERHSAFPDRGFQRAAASLSAARDVPGRVAPLAVVDR